jgi:hypothetical protein
MTLDAGNQPLWPCRQGFFEIWFLVIFVPGQRRALWLRYTLFSPAPTQPGQSRAILWAAAFDAQSNEPALAMKSILPIDAYAPHTDGSFGIRIGDAEFASGVCRGSVQDQGRSIAWDLRFEPSAEQHDRSSIIMNHRLPLPTHVIHAHEGTKFRGTYSVDGTTFPIDDAPGLQKHLWGDKRVEELFWLYCPQFQEDPSARIEVTSVRPSRTLFGNVPFPALTPIWFESNSGSHDFYAAWYLVRNVVKLVGPGKLQLTASSLLRSIEVDADCDLNTLVGYVYRDPKGADLYVAQSDIASCEVRIFERSHPFRSFCQTRTLTSTNGSAIEFHLPEPLEGVHYIGWDETSVVKR